ncbi:MAG TPA: MXAN_5187 C-terminal domain-containing protein [Terriglobia bacterium]|jgi:hypothetical protein|nr:MXAN_5187 C-terminal domain-containing protein [Terriglobia bacterium]
MTEDEELLKLEDDIRRLKIEYEVYFNGGSPRPPRDIVFRIETCIKKYTSDASSLNLGQRFKFNQLVQKYAVNSELWRRKLRDKEEGRGQFAQKRGGDESAEARPVQMVCSGPDIDQEKIDQLLNAMVEAKRKAGERADNVDPRVFGKFIRDKTRQVKKSLQCDKVLFTIVVEGGKVRLKASRAS